MSIEALAIALNSEVAGDPLAKLVLLGLANHADQLGRGAFPSQATLAKYAQCSVRSVRRKLDGLEAAGVIRRGDQRLVDHRRPDQRPIVWDLDLGYMLDPTNTPQLPQADQDDPQNGAESTTGQPDRPSGPVDNHAQRQDTVSPRSDERPDTPDPNDRTLLSYKPSFKPKPPLPPQNPPARPGRPSRKEQQQKDAAAAAANLEAGRQRRAELARARASAIAACGLCDHQGYVGPSICDHDPTAAERTRRGAALVRAVLDRVLVEDGAVSRG